jgi:hypothetical protein
MSTSIQIRTNQDDSQYVTIPNVIDISCSWEVNRAGMFSCRVPRTEFIDAIPVAQRTATYVGAMLRYDHAAAGRWAGKVMTFGVRDGMVEIGAQSLHILARKRLGKLTTNDKRFGGALLYEAVYTSNTSVIPPHNIKTDLDAKEGKPGYLDRSTARFRLPATDGIDLYDELIPMITDDAGMEWEIDEDRYITYARRLGEVRATKLTEGVHIVSAAWTDDLSTVTNILRGFGTTKGSA